MAKKKVSKLSDPLTAEQAKALLTSVGVIRDPVHGDIRLTSLEGLLVDSLEFQRLRHIKELAMVDLVYPGALHNRFVHSLGTLHVCAEMILACNNATKMYTLANVPADIPIPVRIGHYAELIARLTALLHDLAHVPFGHVLQKDAKVFKHDEWKDPWRAEKLLGANSPLRAKVKGFLCKFFAIQDNEDLRLSDAEAEHAGDVILDEVKMALQADSENEILELRYPFVHDLVGNTICADLLDYVQRDMYYCGLTEGLGKRFLQYLAILPTRFDIDSSGQRGSMKPYRVGNDEHVAKPREQKGKTTTFCRLVLLLYKYNSQGSLVSKDNILAEAIDLVRRRKTVAEKLYFHKTKLVATSMLATALSSAGLTSAEELWDMSDLEVLKKVASLHLPAQPEQEQEHQPPVLSAGEEPLPQEKLRLFRASRLATKLLDRQLFKPIYRASFHQPSDDAHSRRLWHEESGAYARYCTPDKRAALIEQIEYAIGLNNGSYEDGIGAVAISCPDKEMQLKAFDMFVLFRPDDIELRRLEETGRPIVKREIEVIKEGHQELWALEVFVDPTCVPLHGAFARRLAGAIQHEVNLVNDLEEFKREETVPMEKLINEIFVDTFLAEKGLTEMIGHEQHQQLVDSVHRNGNNDPRGELLDNLKSMGFLQNDSSDKGDVH